MKRCVGLLIFLLQLGFLSAQNQVTDKLQQQFRDYQQGAMQEKLFGHTDKTFYLAGETVWFKIYSVDGSFHKPLSVSRIVYIEILSKEGKPVIQNKIAMENGTGSGSVALPGFLPSGNYVFRAYTSWMKNFSPDFYFESGLHIVNTLKPSASVPPIKVTGTIQFFPEGGYGLTGVTGKIAFKAMTADGRGLNCTGIIINQQNDTIVRFQSLYNGMGNFLFKPEKNSTYYALVRLNDSLIKQKIPNAEQQGFAMQVDENDSGKYAITVHATPDNNNTSVYLFVQTRQVFKNIQTGIIKEGVINFQVDKKDLGDGVSGITVFNQDRQPVCERLVFKRPIESLLINAATDQPVYHNRKAVSIDLHTSNAVHVPLTANCSMSVFMIDSLQQLPDQSIVSYLYLSSDLKGNIENAEYYFTNPDKSTDLALDNLLLTQGWRRFKWSDITENRKPVFEFLPEIEGPVVNGKIINKLTGSGVPSSVAFLSIPGADYAFSSATSNSQGSVRFGFRDIYNNNAIIVQPALMKDSNYRIDINSSYSDKFSSIPIRQLVLSGSQEQDLLNRSIGNQVENTYNTDKKHQYVKNNFDSTSFYGKPDRVYNLDEFTRFQTTEEVMREYVEDVRVRKDGNKFTFKVRNRLFGTYFEEDPLILFDGIPISDASKIILTDPLKIKKIEVVMHNYFIGSSVFAGIVNVKSYSGELGVSAIDPNALVVEFEGLQQQREFYSPSYATGGETEMHMPDFRNVLYWAPQILTGSDGKSRLNFYTSDLKGKFVVLVQGISGNGLPGKAITRFEVNDSQ